MLNAKIWCSALAIASLSIPAHATVGGAPVQPTDPILASTVMVFPHTLDYQKLANDQKALQSGICTGSVISEHFILTAAHCVNTMKMGALFASVQKIVIVPKAPAVNVGMLNAATIYGEKGNFIAHKYYDFTMMVGPMMHETNDIGLIYIRTNLRELGLTPIPLYAGGKPALISSYAKVSVAGYGDGKYDLENGVVLKKDEMGYAMKKYQTPEDFFPHELVTAQGKKHGSQPGDSGGPVYVEHADGKPLQVAITSHGEGKKRGSDTFIPAYRDWIEATMTELSGVVESVEWRESL